MTIRANPGLRVALLALAMLPAAGQARERADRNRSVESIHQPVVSHTAYTYDVQASGPGLSAYEGQRLADWLQSIGLSYGDQIAMVTDGGYADPALREGIADVVARHGLLIGEDSSASAGAAPQGAVRLIVRRAIASVPGCPDWSSKAETTLDLKTSSNFGCGINSNLAAMVANPEDLVRGQTSDTPLRTATSNRAISVYRAKEPTGAGGLQQITAGGGAQQ